MGTKLFFARHGQTAWNTNGLFQGQADIPLDETGQRQAAALAKRMAQYPLQAVYTSNLQRAWETASAIALFQDCPLVGDRSLVEINLGEWQGLTRAEILEHDPQRLQAWDADRLHNSPPGGETLIELAERVRAGLSRILEKHNEGSVMIVSHAGPLKVMLCDMLGASIENFWRFQLLNATLCVASIYPEGAILEQLNDGCHLKEIG
jgi:broad specificity phosphatase PhoE